jgi:hypothetical protein
MTLSTEIKNESNVMVKCRKCDFYQIVKSTRYGDYGSSNSVTAVTFIHKIHNEFDIIFLTNN